MPRTPSTEQGKKLLAELAESIWRCELMNKIPAGTVMAADLVEGCDQEARAGELRMKLQPGGWGVISVTSVSKPKKAE